MIPRYQIYLFALLLAASLAMGGILWHLRDRAHQRLLAGSDSAPTSAPLIAPAESATLVVANDHDGGLLTQMQSLPLPADPGSRARAVLSRLLDLYAAPDASHPVPGGGASVLQVFLLPALDLSHPALTHPAPAQITPANPTDAKARSATTVTLSSDTAKPETQTGPQLAVVNLAGSFAASHPSGIQTEMLTLLSMTATLHANLPRVTQVRYVVDGETRATLAGHADLTRIYLTTDAAPATGVRP